MRLERFTSEDGGAATTELRVLRRDEWDAWYGALIRAFGGVAEAPERLALYRELTLVDRSIGVWEGAEPVRWAGRSTSG